jgi:phosphotriesterase-related protein
MASFKNICNRRSFINKSSLSIASIVAASFPAIGALASPVEKNQSKLIPTLTGEVASNKLGTTLMHEHILWFGGPGPEGPDYDPIPDHLISDSVDFAVSLLNDAARVGIDAIVDLTPHRPIDLYEQIAKRTPIKIIVSTGFYRRSKSPKWKADMEDEKQMEALMLKEVAEGIDSTKIRAGVIKVAQEAGTLNDWEKKVFRAAAHVSKATGVPITTHTGNAFEQFDLLVKSGANPNKISLSHIDVGRKGIPGELMTIAKEGGRLEIDTFGQEFYTPWVELVALLRSFVMPGLQIKLLSPLIAIGIGKTGRKYLKDLGRPVWIQMQPTGRLPI